MVKKIPPPNLTMHAAKPFIGLLQYSILMGLYNQEGKTAAELFKTLHEAVPNKDWKIASIRMTLTKMIEQGYLTRVPNQDGKVGQPEQVYKIAEHGIAQADKMTLSLKAIQRIAGKPIAPTR